MGDRLTFLGHSTVLVDLDGVRVLTDPLLGHLAAGAIRRHVPAVLPDALGTFPRSSSATVTWTTWISRPCGLSRASRRSSSRPAWGGSSQRRRAGSSTRCGPVIDCRSAI